MRIRQGDVLFLPLHGALPTDAQPLDHGLIAEGDLHTLDGPGVLLRSGNFLFLDAPVATAVAHPEHYRCAIPAGRYQIVRQGYTLD